MVLSSLKARISATVHAASRPVRFAALARTATALAVLCTGCVHRNDPLHYPHDDPVEHYRDYVETISYPDVSTSTPDEIAYSGEPRTLLSEERSEPWDMPLAEAVAIGLRNNRVIRSAGQFLSTGNTLLTAGDRTPSVLDSAIQESGVLFGTRGVESALAAFDANFTSSMLWGRDEQVANNAFLSGGLGTGFTLTGETGAFQSNLSKQFGYGGQLQLAHTVNYLGTNIPGQLFPSAYTGNVNASYRHPLLAGAGTEFTRIAGPINQSFGGLSGVTQGIVIARINSDISIADFQAAIRNLVKDVEDTYWDLYLAYRNFDTAVTARNSALATWRFSKIRVDLGADIDVSAESQSRDQYWASEAAVKNSRSGIFTAETRLRRLLGLPINEGRVIRPSDEPVTAEYLPDWEISLAEALTHRVELRKQKWNIKSLELQLKAAKSLTRPRLDFVANYRVNGFGDKLLSQEDRDIAGTGQGFNSYYETITQGNQTGWGLGFELSMPLGFREAHAQVRNVELLLAKAHEVLFAQEMEVGHELAAGFQELTRAYAAAESNFSRRDAAIDNVETIELQEAGEIKTIDEVLRAQERRAQAEVAFFTSIVEYNKSLTNLHFRKGTLLEDANIRLLEGGWDPGAYVDAYRRAQLRTGSINSPLKHAEPAPFARPTPPGGVTFAHPLTDVGPPSEPVLERTAPHNASDQHARPPSEPASGPLNGPNLNRTGEDGTRGTLPPPVRTSPSPPPEPQVPPANRPRGGETGQQDAADSAWMFDSASALSPTSAAPSPPPDAPAPPGFTPSNTSEPPSFDAYFGTFGAADGL